MPSSELFVEEIKNWKLSSFSKTENSILKKVLQSHEFRVLEWKLFDSREKNTLPDRAKYSSEDSRSRYGREKGGIINLIKSNSYSWIFSFFYPFIERNLNSPWRRIIKYYSHFPSIIFSYILKKWEIILIRPIFHIGMLINFPQKCWSHIREYWFYVVIFFISPLIFCSRLFR